MNYFSRDEDENMTSRKKDLIDHAISAYCRLPLTLEQCLSTKNVEEEEIKNLEACPSKDQLLVEIITKFAEEERKQEISRVQKMIAACMKHLENFKKIDRRKMQQRCDNVK